MTKNAKILFVTSGPPNLRWGGGARRTYQLLHELRAMFGDDAIVYVTLSHLDPTPQAVSHWFLRKVHRAIAKFNDIIENPLQPLSSGGSTPSRYLGHVRTNYLKLIDEHPNIETCIFENLTFSHFSKINSSRGIKTIIAPWGLTSMLINLPYMLPSLEKAKLKKDEFRDRVQIRSAAIALANEMLISAAADRTWYLSKIESGFWHAAGLQASYVPYYAAGEASVELELIKERRKQEKVRRGLFLITSGPVDQNRISLDSLLRQISMEGLPRQAKVVILGTSVPPENYNKYQLPQVEFRGYVPQSEYDEFLGQANAVLVPQVCGFGCLTRISEMVAAGVPVIADAMAAEATGRVPGVVYVEEPTKWLGCINELMERETVASEDEVTEWFNRERNSLRLEMTRSCAA